MSRIFIAYQLHGNNIKYIAFYTVFSVNIVDWLMFFTRKCLSKKQPLLQCMWTSSLNITLLELSEFFLSLHTVLLISKMFSAAWLSIIF